MKNLYKALASFQQEVPVILKGTKGYNYEYADLPAVLEAVNPLMEKHGLGFSQPINGTKIKTIIFHAESGESIESETDMPIDSLVYEEVEKYDKYDKAMKKTSVIKGFEGMNKAQAIGSLITYFRRYSLASILGLVTDKDTDASGEQVVKYGAKPQNTLVKKVISNARQGIPTDIREYQEAFTDPETGEIIADSNFHNMNVARKAHNTDVRNQKKGGIKKSDIFDLTIKAIQAKETPEELLKLQDNIKVNKYFDEEQKDQLYKIIDKKINEYGE